MRRWFAVLLLGLLVGVVLWACSSGPAPVRPATPVPESRVRVASLNAWLLPLASDDLDARFARLPAALRAQDPDIICLQEVWIGSHKSKLTEALRPALPHAARANGGLLVLSRWPIRAQRFVSYPTTDLPIVEKLAGKGLQDLVIEAPWGRLRVVNTHLALDKEVGAPGLRRQLAVLTKHVAAATDLPLVLAGDLNFSAGSGRSLTLPYQTLIRTAKLRDAFAPVRVIRGQWAMRPITRVGWPRRAGVITGWDPDTILWRDGGGAVLDLQDSAVTLDTPATALSDHNLLVATWRRQPALP